MNGTYRQQRYRNFAEEVSTPIAIFVINCHFKHRVDVFNIATEGEAHTQERRSHLHQRVPRTKARKVSKNRFFPQAVAENRTSVNEASLWAAAIAPPRRQVFPAAQVFRRIVALNPRPGVWGAGAAGRGSAAPRRGPREPLPAAPRAPLPSQPPLLPAPRKP